METTRKEKNTTKSNQSQILLPTPAPYSACKRAPERAAPSHIPAKSPRRTQTGVSKASRVEPIPRFERMVGAGRERASRNSEEEIEGGRRESGSVGTQLAANTRAYSISPSPSDITVPKRRSCEETRTPLPPPMPPTDGIQSTLQSLGPSCKT